jgi:hypothetical protein
VEWLAVAKSVVVLSRESFWQAEKMYLSIANLLAQNAKRIGELLH